MARQRSALEQKQFRSKIGSERLRLSGDRGRDEPQQEHPDRSDVLSEGTGPGESAAGSEIGVEGDGEQVQVINDQKCSLFLKFKSSI